MKNQKRRTMAALAGLTLGGLSITGLTVGAASAQGYGGSEPTTVEAPASTVEATVSTVEGELGQPGEIVLVQGTDETEAETPEAENDGRRGHRGGCDLEEAAAVIGIDEAELRTAIDSGETIAEVAVANGVDVDAVIDAMVDAKMDSISEKVADGRITQERADEKLAELEARITDRVNGVQDTPEI